MNDISDIRKDIIESAQEVEAEQSTEQTEVKEPIQQQTDLSQQAETKASIETNVEESQVKEGSDSEPEDIPEPSSWAGEMRQLFKTLPKDVQKYISERERQQHAYISRVGGKLGQIQKEYTEIESVLKPFENDIKESGLSKGQVLERLISERAEMVKDPRTFIKKFADAHNIDLLHVSIDADQADPPEVRKARWEYQTKEQALRQQQQQLEAQQQQIATEQLKTFVETWGTQKPHFQEVRQAMAQVLPEVQQQYPYMSFQEQLDVTYSEVLKHPSFANLNKPKSVPESVKKAGSGINGYTGTSSPQPEPTSIREALLQAAKETGFL